MLLGFVLGKQERFMFWLGVDKNSNIPMIRQLYVKLRESILGGRIQSGTRLPSSRELAIQLSISRNVVLEAYDLLFTEGFVETRRGAGTYVAPGASYSRVVRIEAPLDVEEVTMGYDAPGDSINFRAGTPDLSKFPRKTWLKMVKSVLEQPLDEILAYGHPEGREELRRAICEYVVTQREVFCHPDQIVITAGTTQAIGLVCHLLLSDSRKDVVLENPITYDIQLITKNHGGVLHPVEVDSDGIVTDNLPEMLEPAFVYVTPSHQFPIGGTLPIQRRIDLLRYVEERNCYLVEDDYDSEFRFDGPPLSSLHGLCPEKVVYIGTFSKTLCPAVRIGYIVLPPELINRGRSRKWQSDLHNEVTSQLTLARFIDEGYYLQHVSKMRKHYHNRRKTLEQALKNNFGDHVKILGSATGLHLVARFQGINFSQDQLDKVERRGAKFYGVWGHSFNTRENRDKLLVGYGNLKREDIVKGVEILAESLSGNFVL